MRNHDGANLVLAFRPSALAASCHTAIVLESLEDLGPAFPIQIGLSHDPTAQLAMSDPYCLLFICRKGSRQFRGFLPGHY